jgi:hypothetical protein
LLYAPCPLLLALHLDAENVCEVGMPVSPGFNGLLIGTLYLRGSLREPTEVVSDALANGCINGACDDPLYQPVAVFKLDASPTPRNVTVSTCNITAIDTVLQVLRFSDNGGKLAPQLHHA